MAYSKSDHFTEEEIRLAEIAKALSHPARIAILKFLASQNACICNDLVEELPLSQSTISQHLKALKKAGLIAGEIDGPRTCYCLNMDACTAALEKIDRLFSKINCC
ncbi:MAG: winged helix-turn-helix transcriptional regulator [Saprospiraceae bacterium]|nr:winged helix-turn-helix transcriptional regulator [Saprospiraceae bacterium]